MYLLWAVFLVGIVILGLVITIFLRQEDYHTSAQRKTESVSRNLQNQSEQQNRKISDLISDSPKQTLELLNARMDDLESRLVNHNATLLQDQKEHVATLLQDQKEHVDTLFRNPYRMLHLGNMGKEELFRQRAQFYDMVDSSYDDVNYQPFADVCRLCSENSEAFSTFRQDPYVTNMLEHVSVERGQEYMSLADKLSSEYKIDIPWDRIAKNDEVGSPDIISYKYKGEDIRVCPTTVRYVVFALQTLHRLKSYSDTVDLIEIGGGYGGQCAMFFKLAPLFGVTFRSYTILDLPEPNLLQRTYLKTQLSPDELTKVQCRGVTEESLRKSLHTDSFLFSAYAYAEISPEAQVPYHRILQGYIGHGMIVWNCVRMPVPGFYHMLGKDPHDISIVREYPLTGPHNYIYSF